MLLTPSALRIGTTAPTAVYLGATRLFGAAGGAPGAVTSVTGSSDTGSATINWQPPTTGTVTGYRIARNGTDIYNSGPYTTDVASTARTFTMTGLVNGTAYTLTVAALNGTTVGPVASKTLTPIATGSDFAVNGIAVGTSGCRRADDFLGSIGTNLHVNNIDTSYGNWPGWAAALTDIGFRAVRGSIGKTVDLQVTRLQDLRTRNPRLRILMYRGEPWWGASSFTGDPLTNAPFGTATEIFNNIVANFPPAALMGFEGANEVNNKYGMAGTANWVTPQRAHDIAFANARNANPAYSGLAMVASSFTNAEGPGQLASGWTNNPNAFGNVHNYIDGETSAHVASEVSNRGVSGTSGRVLSTECTVNTAINNTNSQPGLSEKAQGTYLLRQYAAAWLGGIPVTMQYEFLDDQPLTTNPLTDAEGHWGIVRSDLSYKPAATQLKRFIGLLQDPAGNAATFATSTLGYTRSGGDANTRIVELQKADGSHWYLVWQEVKAFDTQTHTDLSPADVSVTLTAPAGQTWTRYKPATGTTAVSSGAGTTFTFPANVDVQIISAAPTAGPANNTVVAQDKYAGWVHSRLHSFTDWLYRNNHTWDRGGGFVGVRGHIGEWGVPGAAHAAAGGGPALVTDADKAAWGKIASSYLRELTRCGLTATWWAAGADWSAFAKGDANDYTLLAFGATNYDQPLSITHPGGQALSDAANLTTAYRGFNGVNVTGWTQGLQVSYLAQNFAFLGSKGIQMVRMPFDWNIWQTAIGQTLNPTTVAQCQTALDAAAANGIKICFDLHMSGKDYTNIDGAAHRVTQEQLADFWVKFTQQFGTHPGVGYLGLMNEPNDTSTGYSGENGYTWWSGVTTYVYNQIRAVNATVPILVPLYAYDDIGGTSHYPSGPWLAPEPNLWWEAHDYWDPFDGGTYPNSYASYLARMPIGPFEATAFTETTTDLTPRYTAVRPAAVQPDAISGLALWLKGTTLTGADNSAVTSWADSSTASATATQATGANQPVLRKTAGTVPLPGGLPYVQFDGGDFLSSAARADTAVTVFVVAAAASWNTVGEGINALVGSSITSGSALRMQNTGTVLRAESDGTGTLTQGNVTVPTGGWHTYTLVYDNPGTVKVMLDETVVAVTSSTTVYSGGQTRRIGDLANAGNGWNGGIAEVVQYNRVLTPAEQTQVRSYLQQRFVATVPGVPAITVANTGAGQTVPGTPSITVS